MSSQRGNAHRSRPQKHQNNNAFKNTMHDTSKKTQSLNNMVLSKCCQQCKEILEWKIRYKKYKPLTVPKKCTNCQEKTIKRAYYILCDACAEKKEVCGKCGKAKEIVTREALTAAEEASRQSQLEQELRQLPERKRRTFLRLQESGQLSGLSANGKDANGKYGDDAESEKVEEEEADSDEEIKSRDVGARGAASEGYASSDDPGSD